MTDARIDAANREALVAGDGQLRTDKLVRMTLVSNTTSGAGTALFVDSVVRMTLVASSTGPPGGNRQTAVSMM
jgi:hypothetical protein